MPFNLLLLPLLGDYVLVAYSTWGRYYHAYLDRQRLLFNSSLAGIFLLAIALGARALVRQLGWADLFTSYRPVDAPYVWTSVTAFALGILLAAVNRGLASRDLAVRRAAQAVGSELDLLLTTAYFDNILLLVTLDTGKFYIAWVGSYPRPNQTEYIRLVPAYSGYRDDRHELVFTTDYQAVYDNYSAEGITDPVGTSGVGLVVELKDVTSFAVFDPEVYIRFQTTRTGQSANQRPSSPRDRTGVA